MINFFFNFQNTEGIIESLIVEKSKNSTVISSYMII